MQEALSRLKRSSGNLAADNGCNKECRETRKAYARDYRRIQKHWQDSSELISKEIKLWAEEAETSERKLENEKNEAKKLRTERDTLKTAVDSLRNDNTQKQRKINEVYEHRKKLEEDNDSLNAKLREKEDELAELKLNHKGLVEDHNKCVEDRQKLTDHCQDLTKILDQKKEEEKQAKTNYEQQLQKNSTLQKQYDQLSQQQKKCAGCAQLKTQLKQMESQPPKDCSQCKQLESDCNTLKEAKAEEYRLRQHAEMMKRDREDKFNDLLEEKEDLLAEKEDLENQVIDANNLIAELNASIQQMESTKNKDKAASKDLELQLKGIKIQLDETVRKLKRSERQNKGLIETNKCVAEELEEFKSREEDGKSSVMEYQKEAKQRAKEIINKKRALDEACKQFQRGNYAHQTLSASCQNCLNTRRELEKVQSYNEDLNQKLQEKKECIEHMSAALRLLNGHGMNRDSWSASTSSNATERVNEYVNSCQSSENQSAAENDGRKRQIKAEDEDETAQGTATTKRSRI